MTRAAPGDLARGALRRRLPKDQRVSVCESDRYPKGASYRMGKESYLLPCMSSYEMCSYFTQHLSGFGVERGRMGEVVSLVGDCRPPPPGNPLQLSTPSGSIVCFDAGLMNLPQVGCKSTSFISIKHKNGGFFLPASIHCSFNKHKSKPNLKNLNNTEYFKNKRSYFSCAGKNPVLKFEHFHSHLCGFREVGPPSIAITNVLET